MDQSQFATLLVVALSRATERILLVMVGALAVYLGYCLFREIPTAKNAEGKVELPGGVSIFLTRIGPGVFFALFGIAVIGYSVAQPVRLDLPNVAVLSGLGQQPGPSTPVLVSGPEPERVVAKLNGLVLEARKQLDPPAAAEFEGAVRSAKYSVMLGRWKSQWGERDAFERWARDNGDKDPAGSPGAGNVGVQDGIAMTGSRIRFPVIVTAVVLAGAAHAGALDTIYDDQDVASLQPRYEQGWRDNYDNVFTKVFTDQERSRLAAVRFRMESADCRQ